MVSTNNNNDMIIDNDINEDNNNNNIDVTLNNNNNSNNIDDFPDKNVDVNKIGIKKLIQSKKIPVNQVVLKEYRKVLVPQNKMKSLKENWVTIVKAIVEHMKLEIRMNPKTKTVELRTSDKTTDSSSMQKSEEFLKAYMCGFELSDSIALLRLEDLYFETFEIKDVKALKGDHLSRCIGRICGEKGKTKYAIENATRTRMIIQGQKISLLGSHTNVAMARNSICSLILGAQPGKVYSQLRVIGKKVSENI